MFNRIFSLILSAILALTLTACGNKDSDSIRVGTISGPETELMQVAQQVALKDGLKIKIVEFSDYNMPNTALNDRSIDANMFQHQPFFRRCKNGYNN